MLVWVNLFLRHLRLAPVESSCPVRTCGVTITAADAPVIINNNNAIRLFPGCHDGTHFCAGRIFTLKTLCPHIKMPLRWDFVKIITVSSFKPHAAFFIFKNFDVLHFGFAVLIVFFHTGIHAVHISPAFGNVERIPKEHSFFCRSKTHVQMLLGVQLM